MDSNANNSFHSRSPSRSTPSARQSPSAPAAKCSPREAFDAWGPGLTDEQKTVLWQAITGHNVFFTGAAGTGKSHLIDRIVGALRACSPKEVVVSAPTGVAAVNIGGQTLNSVTGIGLGEGDFKDLLQRVKSSRASSLWKKMGVLIIDEISMVRASLFDNLNMLGKTLRRAPQAPWGGIQVIACGDFCQLTPVVRGNAHCAEAELAFNARAWDDTFPMAQRFLLTEVKRQDDRAFVEALNEMRRGIISERTAAMIRERERLTIERDERDERSSSWLKPSVDAASRLAAGEYVTERDLQVPFQLFPARSNVEAVNAEAVKVLHGPEVCFAAVEWKLSPMSGSGKDVMLPETLTLRVGAQVMLLKNISVRRSLVNGAIGIVRAFFHPHAGIVAGSPEALEAGLERTPAMDTDTLAFARNHLQEVAEQAQRLLLQLTGPQIPGLPMPSMERIQALHKIEGDASAIIRRIDSNRLLLVDNRGRRLDPPPQYDQIKQNQEAVRKLGRAFVTVEFDHRLVPIFVDRVDSNVGKRTVYSRFQIPLVLAYASTIHKAQGKTLDEAYISLRGTFNNCPAQCYVAISRVKRLEGLWIRHFDPSAFLVSRAALEFYENMARYRELHPQSRDLSFPSPGEARPPPALLPDPPSTPSFTSPTIRPPCPPPVPPLPEPTVPAVPVRPTLTLPPPPVFSVPPNFRAGPAIYGMSEAERQPPEPEPASVTGVPLNSCECDYLPALKELVRRQQQANSLKDLSIK